MVSPTLLTALSLIALLAASGCASETSASAPNDDSQQGELVGGKPDQRWAGSGYLVRGATFESLDQRKVTCGATLIAPRVVVTSAHCVTDAGSTFAFGTGDLGRGPLVRVVARYPHPKFHAEAQGKIDIGYALKKYDVAYLELERAVDFATPAELMDQKPSAGCNVQAIGYRAENGSTPIRMSTKACVIFNLKLGHDPIFEVHPADNSALCVGDGDSGSALVRRDGDKHVLEGIYTGSVTGGLTDCRRGTQFLDGYESVFGFRDFLREGVARVSAGR